MQEYTYVEGRSLVNTGDLLVWSGNSWFSKLIKFATSSEYTHVGIAWKSDETGRLIIFESMDGKGVQLAPLSRRAPVVCFTTEVKAHQLLIDLAIYHWGEKYSWMGCLKAWLGTKLHEDARWQCAEFANYLLNSCGVNIPVQYNTPAKLALYFKDNDHFYIKAKEKEKAKNKC